MPNPPDPNAGDLARIVAALERLAPPPLHVNLNAGAAFVYRPESGGLTPVALRAAPLELILGVERQKEALLSNTLRFAKNLPANNALLWGARGTGKSALIKAVFRAAASAHPDLKIVEVNGAAITALPGLLDALSAQPQRVVVFVDDLSFEGDETTLKALKPALEGSLAAKPEHLVIYAASNRRHLVARDLGENDPTNIHARDAAEDHLALADRFGLWLGFHAMDQPLYLEIVSAYAARLGLPLQGEALEKAALLWAATRGARSGRVAWQFITDLAGREGKSLELG